MREHLRRIPRLIAEATAAITHEYFLLPVADAEGGEPMMQYRERVYAYELYHQLRLRWPEAWPYSLAGEIDKRGHPIIRGGILDDSKPDLLVHVPGEMARNLAVVEIKPLRPDIYPRERDNFQRDMQKLIAFRDVGYAAAILLVFGESRESLDRVRAHARQSGTETGRIELYHHPESGKPAVSVGWE